VEATLGIALNLVAVVFIAVVRVATLYVTGSLTDDALSDSLDHASKLSLAAWYASRPRSQSPLPVPPI
jgi:hypothetical protein